MLIELDLTVYDGPLILPSYPASTLGLAVVFEHAVNALTMARHAARRRGLLGHVRPVRLMRTILRTIRLQLARLGLVGNGFGCALKLPQCSIEDKHLPNNCVS